MRHMYDSDRMIPYAGAVRASVRWKSSRSRGTGTGNRSRATDPFKAVEALEAKLSHQERIRAILATTKYTHDYGQQ